MEETPKNNEEITEQEFAKQDEMVVEHNQSNEEVVEVTTEQLVDEKPNEQPLEQPMDKTVVKPVAKEKPNGWVRLGTTLSVLAFVGFLYSLFASLSFLIVALYYIVIVFIAILTLFLILLNEEFQKYIDGGETLAEIAQALTSTVIYSTSITMGLAALGITLLFTQKKVANRVPGLVFGFVAFIGALALLLFRIFVPIEIVS